MLVSGERKGSIRGKVFRKDAFIRYFESKANQPGFFAKNRDAKAPPQPHLPIDIPMPVFADAEIEAEAAAIKDLHRRYVRATTAKEQNALLESLLALLNKLAAVYVRKARNMSTEQRERYGVLTRVITTATERSAWVVESSARHLPRRAEPANDRGAKASAKANAGRGAGNGDVPAWLRKKRRAGSDRTSRLARDSARVQRKSRVLLGRAKLTGALDQDIVHRIVRRHIGEIETCDAQDVRIDERFGGRLVVAFTIGATGQVTATKVVSSTLIKDRFERCVVAAVRGWLFPMPKGGTAVQVIYPFVLRAAGG